MLFEITKNKTITSNVRCVRAIKGKPHKLRLLVHLKTNLNHFNLKMSISYTGIQDPAIQKNVNLYGAKEFVNVKIDSAITQQLPFPVDYDHSSCFLPRKFIKMADRIEQFSVRSDDIWIVAFPKSGTLWTHNIVWELMNDLSFSNEFHKTNLLFLEQSMCFEENETNRNDNEFHKTLTTLDQRFDNLTNVLSPRIIMSHLPAHFLPKNIWTVKSKLIYVYRNAKDVAISMYHMFHNHVHLRYSGTKENFFDNFLSDCIMYGPFYSHVNGFRKLNHFDHILFIKYEEMVVKPFDVIKRMSEFLDCKYNDDQLRQLAEHVSFLNIQNNSQSERYHQKTGFK